MVVSDVLSLLRNSISETNAGQRWTDANLIQFIDRAQKMLVRELKWPPGRFVFSTAPNVQEYQLQEVIKILGVYLNGQILDRTDIATLEGRQIGFNDSTGTVGGPGGLVVQNQAPALAGSNMTPKWSSAAASTYPVTSSYTGFPSMSGIQPYMTGVRPQYYCEGGNLGIVPAPSAAYTVVCRVVQQPYTIVNATDVMVLPDIAADALMWKAAELAMFSDRTTDSSQDSRSYAAQQYGSALKELRSWRRGYDGSDFNKGVKPVSYRAFSTKGRNRIGAR